MKLKLPSTMVGAFASSVLSGCGSSNFSQPSLSPEGSKTIPLSLIVYEFGKNELRLQEKIKGKSYNLVGIFYEAEEKDGEFKVVLLEEWSSSSYVYAFVPESARDAILKMDRGSLVTITCTGLEKYGSHPSFKSCDFLRHTDTGGEKADMFLDDLIAKNNELLGNTPNF